MDSEKKLRKTLEESLLNLKSFALYMCNGDKYAAEDLIQEIAVKIFSNVDRFKEKTTEEIPKILYVSLRNLFIDGCRKRNRKGSQIAYLDDITKEGFVTDRRMNISEMIQIKNLGYSKLLSEQIQEFMETGLTENQALIFRLACLDDYKYKDIAEVMDMNLNTVLGNVRYARQKLRKFLNEPKENERRKKIRKARVEL